MTAPPHSTPSDRPQKRSWKYKEAAQAYRESHGDPFYTMVWNEQLDALIDDSRVPLYTRGIAWVLRTSQGNLSEFCVNCMPKMDDRDPLPVRLNQTDMKERLKCSAGSASNLLRSYRKCEIILPETEGIYVNDRIAPDLFAQLRQNPDVSPLDSSAASGDGNRLLSFKEFIGPWRESQPDHVAAVALIDEEIARLKALMDDQREQRRPYELDELSAYRSYKRRYEAAQRNGAPNSTNGHVQGVETDSTPDPAGTPTPDGSGEQKVHNSTPPTEPKPNAVNEDPGISSKENTVAPSSSGGNATGKVTTTTDDPNPRTTPERERPDSTATPATETEAERAQVAEAILQQHIPADDLLVDTIIHACRANERTATTDEICHFIDVKGPIAWGKEHPGAYLRTAVSNCFAGASFAEFRKTAASLSRTGPRMPSPAEVEAQRNLIEAQEAELQAWEAQRQRLKEHPEECMKCRGRGHYQFEERRKLCDCPAGDRRRCRGERDSP